MKHKRLTQLEKEICGIKDALIEIGEMRPGSLTRQYRVPADRVGSYYQISYTHKMNSHTSTTTQETGRNISGDRR